MVAGNAAGLLGDNDADALVVVLELLLGLARGVELALGRHVQLLGALHKEPADRSVHLRNA